MWQEVLFALCTLLSIFIGYKCGKRSTAIVNCNNFLLNARYVNLSEAAININQSIPCNKDYRDRHYFSVRSECPVSEEMDLKFSTQLFHNPIHISTEKFIFNYLHHPSNPVRGELMLTFNLKDKKWKDNLQQCQTVYMQRAAVRVDQPNKCIGVVRVVDPKYDDQTKILPANTRYHKSVVNPHAISHRTGSIDWPQVLTNQYQEDYIKKISYRDHHLFLSDALANVHRIIDKLIETIGDPIDPTTGERRTAVVMVANDGVMELVLNFMCSARAANIDLSSFVVFVGQQDSIPLINSMGAKGFYHKSLGKMPSESSESYADRTFAKLMWLKASSVYIVLKAGFNLIFQDADLVWLRDPRPYLLGRNNYDIQFMDDGARTPRFSPFFTNSGFFFIRYGPKTLYFQERMIRTYGEIMFTASHQATMIRHLTESHYFTGMQILILDDLLFPSGRAYHENPKFVGNVLNYTAFPYVWHMCWTPDKENKGKYLGTLGLWYLPDKRKEKGLCYSSSQSKAFVDRSDKVTALLDKCCQIGSYYKGFFDKNIQINETYWM